MQWLQTSYSMWFNRKYGRVGPLFQGRFKSVLVEPSGWGLALSRYMHLNPVRIKTLGLDKGARAADRLGARGEADGRMVRERLKKLREFPWSSYRAYAGKEKAPDWLSTEPVLELGGKGTLREQRESYRKYVEEAVREGLAETPWEQLVGRAVLGSREFLTQVQNVVRGDGRESPQLREVENRPEWLQVAGAVASVRGVRWEELQRRRGDWGRDLGWYFG